MTYLTTEEFRAKHGDEAARDYADLHLAYSAYRAKHCALERALENGWQLVPKKLTNYMWRIGEKALFNGNGEIWKAYSAMLSAAPTPPQVASGWQPIETAPKDGKALCLVAKYGSQPVLAYWNEGHEAWQLHLSDSVLIGKFAPDVWMPLPAAPVAEQTAQPVSAEPVAYKHIGWISRGLVLNERWMFSAIDEQPDIAELMEYRKTYTYKDKLQFEVCEVFAAASSSAAPSRDDVLEEAIEIVLRAHGKTLNQIAAEIRALKTKGGE